MPQFWRSEIQGEDVGRAVPPWDASEGSLPWLSASFLPAVLGTACGQMTPVSALLLAWLCVSKVPFHKGTVKLDRACPNELNSITRKDVVSKYSCILKYWGHNSAHTPLWCFVHAGPAICSAPRDFLPSDRLSLLLPPPV